MLTFKLKSIKMKKFFLILSTSTLLFTASSCSRELDITSEASLSATAPLSESDVDKLLTGVYNRMMRPNSSYPYISIMTTEIMADNYKPVKFQWSQVQFLYEHKTPPGDILLNYMYKDFYTGIDRANTILKVPTASEAQKGKARYARALNYIRLYDLYEEVPIIDEKYDGKPIAKSTKEQILAFIIEDLKFAKANIPSIEGKNIAIEQTLPTKEAATALLARVYRMQGNIAAAGVEAEEIIKSNKFSLAENPLERTGEVIMRFAGNKAESNGLWGWIMSWDARTWNCFAASDDLIALLGENDTRKILFDFAGKKSHNDFIFSKKYKTEDNSDLLVSRLPEMYLISAEAGNAERLTELQKIRKSNLSLDDERRLELSFEWVRWSDLKLKGEKYKLPFPQGALDANELLK